MASAMSSSLFLRYWLNLMTSSTVALFTSTFLGQNLLNIFAYSPVTGWSSGLILSLYCDGCLSTSCILYNCSFVTGLLNVTDTLVYWVCKCCFDHHYSYSYLLGCLWLDTACSCFAGNLGHSFCPCNSGS